MGKFSLTAFRFIVPAQTARTADNLRYLFDYSVESDGTYPGFAPGGGPGGPTSGPGQPGKDYYCGDGKGSGVAEIIIQYTAPDGIYTCTLSAELGYTRYSTRYQFQLSDDVVTILPGATVLSGVYF